jgi:flagellar M-ring protein FliF
MSQSLIRAKQQVEATYRALSPRARLTIAVALLGTGALFSFVVGGDHTSYATLYADLSAEDAGRIVEQLKKTHIPFKLLAEGSAIAVAEDKVHETRLSLASQGLPRAGGVGFEIFDNQKFGVSDFAQQINLRRALQGELERTIAEVDAVRSARVHLALPERQFFAREAQQASASVTVRLEPGRVLSRGSVKAIVNLVSASVQGLPTDAITVVDTTGTMLWSGDQGTSVGGRELGDYRRDIEVSLERRATEMLDRALGANHAVVKVTADLALAQVEQTDEQYDPERTAVRSETTSDDVQEGSSAGNLSGGVAGVRGNLPGGPAPETATTGAPGRTRRKQQTRNFEINKTVRHAIVPAGEIKRLSVAVLVDERSLAGVPDANGKKAGAGDAAARRVDIAVLENVVRQAVGFSPVRGDVVTVRSVVFAEQPSTPGDDEAIPWPQLARHYGAPAGLSLLGLLTAATLLLVMRRVARTTPPAMTIVNRTVRELEQGRSDQQLAEVRPEGSEAQSALPVYRQRALAAAQGDTVRAAQVLRGWITGG